MDSSRGVRDRDFNVDASDDNQQQCDIHSHVANVAREEQTFLDEPGPWQTQIILNTSFVRTLRNRLSEVVRRYTAAPHIPQLSHNTPAVPTVPHTTSVAVLCVQSKLAAFECAQYSQTGYQLDHLTAELVQANNDITGKSTVNNIHAVAAITRGHTTHHSFVLVSWVCRWQRKNQGAAAPRDRSPSGEGVSAARTQSAVVELLNTCPFCWLHTSVVDNKRAICW